MSVFFLCYFVIFEMSIGEMFLVVELASRHHGELVNVFVFVFVFVFVNVFLFFIFLFLFEH